MAEPGQNLYLKSMESSESREFRTRCFMTPVTEELGTSRDLLAMRKRPSYTTGARGSAVGITEGRQANFQKSLPSPHLHDSVTS